MAKLIRFVALAIGVGLVFGVAATHADTTIPPAEGTGSIWKALGNCALFGGLGILMVTFGFMIFDWIITKIDLQAEINKGNVAAAILSAAAIIGISIIVATAIH